MFRSTSAELLALLALATFALAVPARAADPQSLPVQDITYPVQDIVYDVSDLDRSVTVNARRVSLAADVLFAFNSAKLSPRAGSRLAEAVREIRKREAKRVLVDGYTDSKGTPAFNQRLSARRAQAVRDALRKRLGGDASRLTARAFGERKPIAANETKDGKDSPRGRARNRRVEISFR